MPRARTGLASLIAARAGSSRPAPTRRRGGTWVRRGARARLADIAIRKSPRVRRGAAIVAAIVTTLTGGWLWVRDSPLVAIEQVKIVGVRGPGAKVIRGALTDAARGMTTLDLDLGRLRRAASVYTAVASIGATTRFPHGVRIDIQQRLPVAAISGPHGRLAVAGDGTVLAGIPAPSGLVLLAGPPRTTAGRISDPRLRTLVTLMASAPDALRPRVDRAFAGPRGLEVAVRNGPELYFGDASRPQAKWAAAARVLADPGSTGARYIDVRLPDRPAAVVPGSQSSGPSSSSASGAASTTGAGAGSGGPTGASATGPGGGSRGGAQGP